MTNIDDIWGQPTQPQQAPVIQGGGANIDDIWHNVKPSAPTQPKSFWQRQADTANDVGNALTPSLPNSPAELGQGLLNRGLVATHSLGNMATFGGADKLGAAVSSAVNDVPYSDVRNWQNQQFGGLASQYPASNFAGGAAGVVAGPGAALSDVLKGGSMATRAGKAYLGATGINAAEQVGNGNYVGSTNMVGDIAKNAYQGASDYHNLLAPALSVGMDAIAGMKPALTDNYDGSNATPGGAGVPLTSGQSSGNPAQLAFEKDVMSGKYGKTNMTTAQDFKATQQEALQDQTSQVAGGIQDPAVAGQTAIQAVKDAANKSQTNYENLYDAAQPDLENITVPQGSVQNSMSGNTGTTIDKVLGDLKSYVDSNRTSPTAKSIGGQVKALDNGAPVSLYDLENLYKTIGQAGKEPNIIGGAKNILNNHIMDIAGQAGNEGAADSLMAARDAYSQHQDIFNNPQSPVIKGIANADTDLTPENIVSKIFNGTNPVGNINALKNIVNPDVWNNLQQGYFGDMLKNNTKLNPAPPGAAPTTSLNTLGFANDLNDTLSSSAGKAAFDPDQAVQMERLKNVSNTLSQTGKAPAVVGGDPVAWVKNALGHVPGIAQASDWARNQLTTSKVNSAFGGKSPINGNIGLPAALSQGDVPQDIPDWRKYFNSKPALSQ